jgi:hypothetical protein
MVKRIAAVVALALLALGPARAEQEDGLGMSLTAKTPSFKNVRKPLLILNGTCALPDGVELKLNMTRVVEQMLGTEISPLFIGAGNGCPGVTGKKYMYDIPIDGPGKYVVNVAIIDDLQQKHLVPEIKKKVGDKRNHQYEFLVWGDDLVGTVSSKLIEMTALTKECADMVKKFEQASASKEQWAAESKVMTAEGGKLIVKLETHELKAYFPGAVGNLYYTIRTVVNNGPYYTYGPDGKFSGARDYHADGQKVKTFRNDEFNWDSLKKYVDDTPGFAGREFCLWIVKDLRRTAGQMRPDIQEAIKAHKADPGVDFWQERLSKATFSDLDVLEKELRGPKDPKMAPKAEKQ